MNLDDLASFVRVVELGTITAAADEAGVPKSTISRRIARLEESLGVELLRRSARAVTVTEDGILLHRRAGAALQELDTLEQQLTDARQTPHGTLVLSVVPELGRASAFVELLRGYAQTYPEVSFELRLEQRVVDIIHEGVDVAVRAHRGDIPGEAGLMTRRVSRSEGALYAHPEYLARHGHPKVARDLLNHHFVVHPAHEADLRRLWVAAQSSPVGPPPFRFRVDDYTMAQSLIQTGVAIGVLPKLAAARPEAEGTLVALLPEWSTAAGSVSLVWPSSRHLAPRVRTFVDLATRLLIDEKWAEDPWR